MAISTASVNQNATATLYTFVRKLRARVTRATVREELPMHPDFPSLLSLSEVLMDWEIDNTALQLNTMEQLRELPLPFIAHQRTNGGWFVVVTALQGDTITYTDSSRGRVTEPVAEFANQWTGVVLLAETNEQSGEPDYETNHKQERLENLHKPVLIAGSLLVASLVIGSIAKELKAPDWILLVTKSIGLLVSVLLVAKQLGANNGLTDRLCHINSKTDCDSVLNSPGAKLWGWLSWADVGLLYFAGGLLTILMMGNQPTVRPLLNLLSLLALPYTLYFVYYQARVVRQWCTLCLAVQGILLIEGTMAAIQITTLPTAWQPYAIMLTAFLLSVLAWVFIKPLVNKEAISQQEHEELLRFKRNPELFRAMLIQQPQMPPVPFDLHPIILGNPEAEHTITMVTNPYCGPCAKMHEKLTNLLERSDTIKVQIIFSVQHDPNSNSYKVAKHLLALSRELPPKEVLANWYHVKQQEDAVLPVLKHIDCSSDTFNEIVIKHSIWCSGARVDRTPVVFVDGFMLPEVYSVSSLQWLVGHLPVTVSKMDLAKSI